MPYYRIGGFFLLLIAVSHLTGHFILLPFFHLAYDIGSWIPQNQEEKHLLELMNNYKKPLGGTTITMLELQNGLSLCYALLFLWSGLLVLITYKPLRRNHRLLAQFSLVNLIALSLGTVISIVYFFWLPATSFGVGGLLFLLAYLKFSRSRQF